MNGKPSRKYLEEDGWAPDRISVSHPIMVKENDRSIPIPIHGATNLPKGLVKKILKQAGVKRVWGLTLAR